MHVNLGLFNIPEYILLRQLDEIYPLNKNRYAARRYKHLPFVNSKHAGKNVLFVDADTLVYRDILPEIFDLIQSESILVYGGVRADSFKWYPFLKMNRARGMEDYLVPALIKNKWLKSSRIIRLFFSWLREGGFSLKEAAALAGFTVPNFSLNSGIVGRAADDVGRSFVDRLKVLFDTLPLPCFTTEDLSAGHYFNDEPYFALAYLIEGYNKGFISSGLDSTQYITTVNATVSTDVSSGRLIVTKNGAKYSPAMVHFVGYANHAVYLEQVRNSLGFDLLAL